MRNYLLVAFILIFMTGCAGPQVVERAFDTTRIQHMTALNQLQEPINLGDSVFYLDKGDRIPIKLQFASDLMAFEEEQVHLVLNKKLYFRFEASPDASATDQSRLLSLTPETLAQMENAELGALLKQITFYLSTDAKRWALLTDLRGLKEVLQIEGGKVAMRMSVSRVDGLWFLVSVLMRSHAIEPAAS